MLREAIKVSSDLSPYALVERIMRDNRAADESHVKRLVRRALLGDDKDYLDAFIDFTTSRCYANYRSREEVRLASVPQQRREYTPQAADARSPKRILDTSKSDAKARGRTRFAQNREAIEAMSFANGRGILEQTVEDAQRYGGWFVAIIRALPTTAKTSDRLGKYLTIDQLTKLRTFDVTAA